MAKHKLSVVFQHQGYLTYRCMRCWHMTVPSLIFNEVLRFSLKEHMLRVSVSMCWRTNACVGQCYVGLVWYVWFPVHFWKLIKIKFLPKKKHFNKPSHAVIIRIDQQHTFPLTTQFTRRWLLHRDTAFVFYFAFNTVLCHGIPPSVKCYAVGTGVRACGNLCII